MGILDSGLDKALDFLKDDIFDTAVDFVKDELWDEFGDEIEEIFEDVNEAQATLSVIAQHLEQLDEGESGVDDEVAELIQSANEKVDRLQARLLEFFNAEEVESDQ